MYNSMVIIIIIIFSKPSEESQLIGLCRQQTHVAQQQMQGEKRRANGFWTKRRPTQPIRTP